MPELLVELLSEEIPARMQARAAEDLKRLVCDRFKKASLSFESARAFVTPRRLTLVVDGLPTKTEPGKEERPGPRVGSPEKAIKGFLKTVKRPSVDDDDISIRKTDKGDYYFFEADTAPKQTANLLTLLLTGAIDAVPWPKSMRWKQGQTQGWIRPLRGILAIFDGEALALEYHLIHRPEVVANHTKQNTVFAGSETIGHPFLSPEPIKDVQNFADYAAKLKAAHVILDPAERRTVIEAGAEKLAQKAGLALKDDPALLDEVTGLVEWPVVLIGEIDEAFMGLPREVLTTAMRHHQKYFALTDKKGKLAPKFIVVANTETKDGGKAIIAGNERVLSARLADAKFFWDQDLKRTLESRVEDLGGRVFHAKLGSVLDKAARVEKLAGRLAETSGADAKTASQAARLAKADLSTEMVVEFPELQGVMGRYYALHEGEDKSVADAIAEHYAPKGPGDACPSAPVSVAVALADKIDTLVGFFAIDEKPTGSKDPFALRRAALGVIRLILENELTFAVRILIEWAWENFPEGDNLDLLNAFREDLRVFFFDRLKVHLRDKGVRHDLIEALFARGADDDLLRIVRKAEVLGRFLETDDGANLLVAYRRANNIVRIEEKKRNESFSSAPIEAEFEQEEEIVLWEALNRVVQEGGTNLDMAQFEKAILALSGLRKPVDAFFDHVTVICGVENLERNRLKLLSQISESMFRVADFSRIEGGER